MQFLAMRPTPHGFVPRHQRRSLIKSALVVAAMLHAMACCSAAFANDADHYPSKPLRLIVPFAPGGSADVIGRAVGEQLQHELGESVLIINRDGAGTIVGVNYATHSAPDGYTLLLSGDAATINTASGRTLPYDFTKDLQPVSILFTGPQVLLVNKASPFKTLTDLVNNARANPGRLKYGSSGVGTSVHLSLEAFNAAAGIKGVHVPYRGVAPAITDLMGGQIDYVIAGLSYALPAIKGGSLKALAITSDKRSPLMPDLPTAKEQGVNVLTAGWYGLFVPEGTPPQIIDKLNAATQTALKSPQLTKRFNALGGEARGSTPAQAGAFVEAEIHKFSTLMQTLDIKLEN
jgi:tripartite-type tricarboxylate transporter receptor subunit TctC